MLLNVDGVRYKDKNDDNKIIEFMGDDYISFDANEVTYLKDGVEEKMYIYPESSEHDMQIVYKLDGYYYAYILPFEIFKIVEDDVVQNTPAVATVEVLEPVVNIPDHHVNRLYDVLEKAIDGLKRK